MRRFVENVRARASFLRANCRCQLAVARSSSCRVCRRALGARNERREQDDIDRSGDNFRAARSIACRTRRLWCSRCSRRHSQAAAVARLHSRLEAIGHAPTMRARLFTRSYYARARATIVFNRDARSRQVRDCSSNSSDGGSDAPIVQLARVLAPSKNALK